MDSLQEEVAKIAQEAVKTAKTRGGTPLDFSEGSLAAVEEILAEAAEWRAEMPDEAVSKLSHHFGCYILEVGRRLFGGTYHWMEDRDQPVLVVGEPKFHVAIITWDKVAARLAGDPADNIPFFFEGFAERARAAVPGDRALYV